MSLRKLESPSAERNKDPIWEVLARRVVPPILHGLSSAKHKDSNQPTAQKDQPRGSGGDDVDDGGDNDGAGERNAIRVLEIAAGAGVHMQHFALNFLKLLEERRPNLVGDSQQREPNPMLRWYPTDASRASLASQLAYRDDECEQLRTAIREPLQLTLNERGIVEPATLHRLESVAENGGGGFQLIVCINMVHIAPWGATIGLFQVASQFLHKDESSGAALVLYGPFRVQGSMVESNVRFDGWLKGQDPGFGVRNLEDVVAAARRAGLQLAETVEMPANNLCVVFRRAPGAAVSSSSSE